MKKLKIIIIALAVILFFSFMVMTFIKEVRRNKLDVLGRVEPFSLTGLDGKEFNSQELDGKVWVADFIFTTCSTICPKMTKNMASLHRSFEMEPGVKLVSITVNPEYDTPEVLNAYAKKYKANTDQWIFLTGTRDKIKDILLNSFKLGSIEKPIFHSSYFTLVDRYGLIRGYYDGTKKEEVDRLFKDSAQLLKAR